jgi:hypothetical protein
LSGGERQNNLIFGDGKCGIEQSSLYLLSYHDAVQNLKEETKQTDAKGKRAILDLSISSQISESSPAETWKTHVQVGQN